MSALQPEVNDESMKESAHMEDTTQTNTFGGSNSRRGFLKGAMASGLAAGGLGLLTGGAHAQATATDTPTQIFSIAATAERLAVTFYTNGMNNAAVLGLNAEELGIIQAALIEEQIHELFFEKNGGTALTSTFSFPAGAATFTDLQTFLSTQQLLEGAFDSAFIAAAYEFAEMGMSDVARIAVQIAMVEDEHRALGNYIATSHGLKAPALTVSDATASATDVAVLKAIEAAFSPADNWAFAPQLVPTVGAAPGVLKAAGFLAPVAGNTYTYQQVDFSSGTLGTVASNLMYNNGPFVAAATTPTAAKVVGGWERGHRTDLSLDD